MIFAITGAGASIESDYPADWDQRRRAVYQRDDYTCRNCGIKGGSRGNAELHAHHIVPKSKGGVHDQPNLVTLCDACHDAVHKPAALAPTAFLGEGAEPEPPSLWGSWLIQFVLLVLTVGVGNILYLWWRWRKRRNWKAARER